MPTFVFVVLFWTSVSNSCTRLYFVYYYSGHACPRLSISDSALLLLLLLSPTISRYHLILLLSSFFLRFLRYVIFQDLSPPQKKPILKKGEHIKPYGVCLALLYSLSYIYTHTQTYIHIHIYTYDVQKRVSLKGLRTWGLSVQQVLCLLSKKLFRKSIECVIICQNSFHPVMHNSRQCRRISTGAPS